MIEGHGNNIHQAGIRIVADFSSNVAGKPHQKLLEYLSGKINTVGNYPEPFARSLREKMARKHDVKPSQILITNGSTEAFYLVASAFREKHSLVFTPSFAEYEDACRMHRHHLKFASTQQFTQALQSVPDLVWLGNPGNPDGSFIPVETIKKKLADYSKTLFVIDEAYSGLCSNFESLAGNIDNFSNLIVVQSMTKLFAIPGLRLGYLLASQPVMDYLQHFLMPWSVNALAIEAGKFIVDHEQKLMPDISEILFQSGLMQTKFSQCNKLEVIHSPCNYFLVKLKKGNAPALKKYLLEEHGFLIRDASNFRGLDERFFRIAVQDETSNQKLHEAIIHWLEI